MNRTKIAAIVFILSAGIIASYAILKNAVPKIDLTKSGLTEENSTSSIAQNPIKWLGKAVAKFNDFISGESSEPAQISLPKDIDFENINLTEFVAKSSFTQMKNLDQSGKDPFEIDPNDPANKEFLEKAIASIQNPETIFNIFIDNKDLEISQDNSMENKIKYVENFEKIMVKNTNNDIYKNADKAVAAVVEQNNVSDVKKLADIYENIFNELINISIPSNYLEVHKDYLRIVKKMEIIYSGVADFQNDPVKASLLIKLWPEVVRAEANFFRVSKFN